MNPEVAAAPAESTSAHEFDRVRVDGSRGVVVDGGESEGLADLGGSAHFDAPVFVVMAMRLVVLVTVNVPKPTHRG